MPVLGIFRTSLVSGELAKILIIAPKIIFKNPSMVEGRAMIRLLVLVVAAASLLPSSDCSTLIHQQLQIPGKGYKFRVSRYDDGRKTPYRIYFWDTNLTGSSYRFDGDGNLVFFKAGSDIYSKVFIRDGDAGVEFSLKTESVGGKNDDGDNKEYSWEDFSCSQCSTILHSICGTESSEPGGLTKFCDAVDLSTLGGDGADSVKTLCDNRIDTCAELAAECDSPCDLDGKCVMLRQSIPSISKVLFAFTSAES